MTEQPTPTGAPDAFLRPGQDAPARGTTPAQPWAAPTGSPVLPPSTTPAPTPQLAHTPLGGATAVGGPRRRSSPARLAAAVGSVTAIAILAASGFLGGRAASLTLRPAGQPTAAAPATTAPANRAPNAGTSTNAGTVASGSSAVTDAESKGVVLIDTVLPGGSAAGTGMVIDASGLVLTNYHVVAGSSKVRVTIATTGSTYDATVVGHDAVRDVALLKLAGASGLDVVAIDRDAVAVGQPVTAVGNANGQGFLSGASGAITNTSANVTVSNDSASGTETLNGVYETDAKAQPGDSGGPLFDAQNEVAGMTTAGEQTYRGGARSQQSTTVVSYAIPIARALAIVDQIKAGQESGTVRVGPNAYLGVMVATGAAGKATVADVTAGTPAAKAGITAGSTLTSIGGVTVSTQAEIAAALATRDPGQAVKVTWTDASGAAHTAQVTLAASPLN